MKLKLSLTLFYLSCSSWVYSADSIAVPAPASPAAGYHIYAHSHNDYAHERPLLDALDNRCYSIEGDFWFVDGEILIAHDQGENKSDYKGSLKDLYLDPLQKRVDEKGSVYGDGVPVYLWLDIKDGRAEARPVLHELLRRYSMLTVYTDGSVKPGMVTVVLTGDAASKQAYVDDYITRYACRDSNDFSPNDPPADNRWQWYAVNFKNVIKWYGDEPIAPEEREKWAKIVNDVHAKGRKIRLWNAPDTPLFWKTALEVGVDLVNTDKLAELNQFLEGYSTQK